MLSSNGNNVSLDSSSSEDIILEKITEIVHLEKLIEASLEEIKLLQEELTDLESDLNVFLDQYYGSGATFFKSNSNNLEKNDNSSLIIDLDQAKKDIYNKIAKVCSKDAFHFGSDLVTDVRSNLLKIEGYLTDGTENSSSPQDVLSALAQEYCNLTAQISQLKEEKQGILDHTAFELKQKVTWANIKKAEVISKIKDGITHRVNLPN
jgi:hypothetical protein